MNRQTSALALAAALVAGCGGGATVDTQAIEETLDAQMEGDDLRMFITELDASGTWVIVSTQLGAGGGTAEAEAICGNVVAASYSSGDDGVTTDVTRVEVQDASGSTVASCKPQY